MKRDIDAPRESLHESRWVANGLWLWNVVLDAWSFIFGLLLLFHPLGLQLIFGYWLDSCRCKVMVYFPYIIYSNFFFFKLFVVKVSMVGSSKFEICCNLYNTSKHATQAVCKSKGYQLKARGHYWKQRQVQNGGHEQKVWINMESFYINILWPQKDVSVFCIFI